jgi:hypothetical protein
MLIFENRLAAIIESEPLELDGEAYKGKFYLEAKDFKSMRKGIALCIKDLQGKIFINKETGNEITISNKGLRELVSFVKKDEVYIKSLAYIPNIIENMRYLETKPNMKNDGYASFDYYITPVIMDGENYIVSSVVGKSTNGEYYYHQNIFRRDLYNSAPAPEAGAVMQVSINNIINYFKDSKVLDKRSEK